jgi:hypothetical protein
MTKLSKKVQDNLEENYFAEKEQLEPYVEPVDRGIFIPVAVEKLVQLVLSGELNPLEVYVTIKKVEEALKQAKKELLELAVDEAAKYGTGSYSVYNADITLKNSAGRWDFTKIPGVISKELELKALKDKHKAALKHDIVDTETGELVQAPIFNPGRETISIKLKKS